MSVDTHPEPDDSDTFRTQVPSRWLVAGSLVVGGAALLVLTATLFQAIREAFAGGDLGSLLLPFFDGIGLLCIVAFWMLRSVRLSGVRWVRVSPVSGLALSDGRTIPWRAVRGVQRHRRLVVVRRDAGGSIRLDEVIDAERLAALVRRYSGRERSGAA